MKNNEHILQKLKYLFLPIHYCYYDKIAQKMILCEWKDTYQSQKNDWCMR